MIPLATLVGALYVCIPALLLLVAPYLLDAVSAARSACVALYELARTKRNALVVATFYYRLQLRSFYYACSDVVLVAARATERYAMPNRYLMRVFLTLC